MIGRRLKNHWLSHGIEINPGVSMKSCARFEAKYRVALPADLQDYCLTVNGMAEGVSNNALFRFWSLNELKPITDEAPDYSDNSYIEDAESLFVFADFCIWSHAYTIRLSSDQGPNPIIVIGGETPTRMLDSFSELVIDYLTDADLLLGTSTNRPKSSVLI